MIRFVRFFFVFFSLTSCLYAQSLDLPSHILNAPYHKESAIDMHQANTLYLETDFASASIRDPEKIFFLQSKTVSAIELVYTLFKEREQFNQDRLNRNRLLELQKIAPELLNNTLVKWRFIGQTECTSAKEGRSMFHGFVIHYKITQTKETMAKEIAYLDSVSTIISSLSMKDSILYFTKSKWDEKKGYVPDSSSAVYANQSKKQEFTLKEKNIIDVFDRHPMWKNMLIIADVTGSMSPFSAQILYWHNEMNNTKKASHFVFFNDGDDTPEYQKQPGSTGGIYDVPNGSSRDLVSAIRFAMERGYGGATPENDIEAVLVGINKCPTCSDIVLIADNTSPISDFSLFEKVTKPIKIILCGNESELNEQYLTLAYKTGGSVHTSTEDVQFSHVVEGKSVVINKQEYWLKNGRFSRLYRIQNTN